MHPCNQWTMKLGSVDQQSSVLASEVRHQIFNQSYVSAINSLYHPKSNSNCLELDGKCLSPAVQLRIIQQNKLSGLLILGIVRSDFYTYSYHTDFADSFCAKVLLRQILCFCVDKQIRREVSMNFTLGLVYARIAITAMFLAMACNSCLSAKESQQQPPSPNVLLIVSDDLNTDLGCYGNNIVKTPNIDRLAARGLRFEHAYCQGTVCNSSRASIFSGLRPLATNVLDNETPWPDRLPGSEYMPAYFQQLGYFTATLGKILDHKRVPEQPYWDHEVREWGKYPEEDQILKQGRFYPGSPGSMFWAQLNNFDEITPDGEIALKAAKLLESRKDSEKPFFIAVGFRRPHTPYAAPRKYFDLYSPEQIQVPEIPNGYRKTLPPGVTDLKPFVGGLEETKRAIAAYYACISFVDNQVGLLLQTMDEQDLWDNTVVVFISDHGYHTGHNGLWHKGWLFEQTTRTPMIFVTPHGSSGVCERVVEFVDIYPTFAELCGQLPPAALAGTSLVPLLNSPEQKWEKNAFSSTAVLDENNRQLFVGNSVRTSDYRYTEWDEGKQGEEFYSFADDPQGLMNRANDPTFTKQRQELREMLHSMCASP